MEWHGTFSSRRLQLFRHNLISSFRHHCLLYRHNASIRSSLVPCFSTATSYADVSGVQFLVGSLSSCCRRHKSSTSLGLSFVFFSYCSFVCSCIVSSMLVSPPLYKSVFFVGDVGLDEHSDRYVCLLDHHVKPLTPVLRGTA